MMKCHKVTLCVISDLPMNEVVDLIENGVEPFSPTVVQVESVSLPDWSDDHPLNKQETADATFVELFGPLTSYMGGSYG